MLEKWWSWGPDVFTSITELMQYFSQNRDKINLFIILYDNVYLSIEYLFSLGVDIKTIEDMLFNDYTIFMGGKSSLEKLLGNVDKEKLVYYLNNNFIDI